MKDISGDLDNYHKKDIAMQHFNLALTEYVRGDNLFSVIHLAGAAEEMFGKLLVIKGKESALSKVQKWLQSWYSITKKETPKAGILNKQILKVKNGVKHIDDSTDLIITFDIKKESNQIIRRAIENFKQLPEVKTSKELLAYYEYDRDTDVA